jgi:hypothetical protein
VTEREASPCVCIQRGLFDRGRGFRMLCMYASNEVFSTAAAGRTIASLLCRVVTLFTPWISHLVSLQKHHHHLTLSLSLSLSALLCSADQPDQWHTSQCEPHPHPLTLHRSPRLTWPAGRLTMSDRSCRATRPDSLTRRPPSTLTLSMVSTAA